jgi:hypothetical protein
MTTLWQSRTLLFSAPIRDLARWKAEQDYWPLAYLPGYPGWEFGPVSISLSRTTTFPYYQGGQQPPPIWYSWRLRGTVKIVDTELIVSWQGR